MLRRNKRRDVTELEKHEIGFDWEHPNWEVKDIPTDDIFGDGVLRDDNPDTGCALKLFERDLFLKLPYFDHIHRFLPALAKREDCRIVVVPVNHRHRARGVSKYANFERLIAGVIDLLGVMWLIRRYPKNLDSKE